MRRVILVAHEDNRKQMIDWLKSRRQDFSAIDFFVPQSTGAEIVLKARMPVKFLPGPPEADEVVRKLIEDGCIDMVILLWNWQFPHPCPVDIDALLRLAFIQNVPIALNPLTAENHIDSLLQGREKIRMRSGTGAKAMRQQSERKTA
jgi:methylglyoxal synthase